MFKLDVEIMQLIQQGVAAAGNCCIAAEHAA